MARVRSGYIYKEKPKVGEDGKKKKDAGYWVRISYTDPTGKRRTVKRRAATITDAKELQKKLNNQLDGNLEAFSEGGKTAVGDYLDRWLRDVAKPRLSARTFKDYQSICESYLKPALGSKRLANLKAPAIQALYTELLEKELSPRTIQYIHVVLRSALKQAVKWRLLVYNPTDAVELPRQKRNEMKALSPAEAAKFLEAASKDRYGTLFAFALATGMRPGEYFGLQWKDIDLEAGTVTVRRTVNREGKGGGWSFGEPKTSKSRRTITLPGTIVAALKDHRKAQNEEVRKRKDYVDHDLVFCSEKGTPLELRNLVLRHFKPILTAAGLSEDIRLYDLRHSCATLLLTADENPKVVSERLGHANIGLTLDVYSHVLPTMQRKAAEKLEGLLFPKVKKKRPRSKPGKKSKRSSK